MTSTLIQIRQATTHDWEVIADFNTRLASETEGKQLDCETIQAGVQVFLGDEHRGRYFVAVNNGRVVGQMAHTREWSDWRNGEIWWLQSVYVLAEFRQQGVFRALYQHLESLAICSPDVIGVRLYVETHNRKAQDAYARLGLRDANYCVMERIFRNDV
ncbi:MAG TPA: GNAT family N-acetyltransferase [Schlesneria sp.]|jgi:GNAT superfamily N-acetyltransferase